MPQQQAKMSPRRYAKLIKHLQEGEYTCRELAELTDLHYVTVLEYTKALKDQGLIHIAKWDRDALGRDAIKVYVWGGGADAPRRTLGRTEQQRRYRARRMLRETGLIEAIIQQGE